MTESHRQDVQIYVSTAGVAPLVSWLEGLGDRRARALIRIRIARLEVGNFGDSHSLGGGVFELRINPGPGYRVYFARVGVVKVVLLCGGSKARQESDIERARRFWSDYRKREWRTEAR